MPVSKTPPHADVMASARQARAESVRRWLALLCASLAAFLGAGASDPGSWRRE